MSGGCVHESDPSLPVVSDLAANQHRLYESELLWAGDMSMTELRVNSIELPFGLQHEHRQAPWTEKRPVHDFD